MKNELPVVFFTSKKNLVASKITKIIFFSLLILAAILLFYFTKISVVICQFKQDPCPDEIVKQLNFQNKSIFFTDIEQSVQKIIFIKPIKLVEIKRYLPGKLSLSFTSVEYLYQLKFGNSYFSVDNDGNLYPAESQANLIMIEIEEQKFDQLVENSRLKPNYHGQLTRGLDQLAKAQMKIKQFFLTNDILVIKLENYPQLLLTLDNFSQEIENFLLINQQIDVNQYQPSIMEIDLRFDLPILKERSSDLNS